VERSLSPEGAGSMRYAVGVDRGASSVRLGLVRSDGTMVKVMKEWDPCRSLADLGSMVRRMGEMLARFLASPEVRGVSLDGIGVVVAGIINGRGEMVGHVGAREAPWTPIAVREVVQQTAGAGLPVHVDNDSKGAALGEFLYGAGRGTRDMACLTIGTGVGGGLVVDGKLVHGAQGLAGLAGIMSVDMHGERCPSGAMGCLEHYASGSGIARAARRALEVGRASGLLEDAQGDIESVTSEMVFAAARRGDDLAKETVRNAAYALGIAISTLLHLLNPEVVVLGGGVAEQGELFLEPVRDAVAEHTIAHYLVPIKAAELGNLAGVTGAAALCWQ